MIIESRSREAHGTGGLPWHLNAGRRSIRNLFSPWLARAAALGRTARTRSSCHRETPRMRSSTRSRVSFFMNKFRKLGHIDYKRGIEVHGSLLNVVLHDEPHI